jgi:hypothetical protein
MGWRIASAVLILCGCSGAQSPALGAITGEDASAGADSAAGDSGAAPDVAAPAPDAGGDAYIAPEQDAGPGVDAASSDASDASDAHQADAGELDAADAAPAPDAGPVDAGPAPDAALSSCLQTCDDSSGAGCCTSEGACVLPSAFTDTACPGYIPVDGGAYACWSCAANFRNHCTHGPYGWGCGP